MPNLDKEKNNHAIQIECRGKEDGDKKVAELCLDSASNAAGLGSIVHKDFGVDINPLLKAIQADCDKVASGDTKSLEKMLTGQVHALQAIFSYASNKVVNSQYLNQMAVYGKLALKAQNQCRQTVATIANIKAPKSTTFIKNQATNQQVNFNSEKKQANELLNEEQHAPMDTGRTTTPSSTNQEMETLDA